MILENECTKTLHIHILTIKLSLFNPMGPAPFKTQWSPCSLSIFFFRKNGWRESVPLVPLSLVAANYAVAYCNSGETIFTLPWHRPSWAPMDVMTLPGATFQALMIDPPKLDTDPMRYYAWMKRSSVFSWEMLCAIYQYPLSGCPHSLFIGYHMQSNALEFVWNSRNCGACSLPGVVE